MADVQLENGYIRVATELMDEIIRRDFSKRQLAILHFIIRLSYGCQKKDCFIEKFNLFEIAGINKVDIKKELKFLRDCGVINWDEITMVFSINKDYEKWQITPSKGFEREKFDKLIHQNIDKKVSKTLTPLENLVSKTLTEMGEKVSKTLTKKLVKYLLEKHGNDWESKDELLLKDSIKDIYLKINTTTTTTENPIQLFEKLLCRLSSNQSHSLYKWVDDFGGKTEIVNEAITIADNKNKRYFGFVEFLLREWANNNLNDLERIRVYEKEKFNKLKARKGKYNKPIRKEQLPEWFEEDQSPIKEHKNQEPVDINAKKREIEEMLKAFDG